MLGLNDKCWHSWLVKISGWKLFFFLHWITDQIRTRSARFPSCILSGERKQKDTNVWCRRTHRTNKVSSDVVTVLGGADTFDEIGVGGYSNYVVDWSVRPVIYGLPSAGHRAIRGKTEHNISYRNIANRLVRAAWNLREIFTRAFTLHTQRSLTHNFEYNWHVEANNTYIKTLDTLLCHADIRSFVQTSRRCSLVRNFMARSSINIYAILRIFS